MHVFVNKTKFGQVLSIYQSEKKLQTFCYKQTDFFFFFFFFFFFVKQDG